MNGLKRFLFALFLLLPVAAAAQSLQSLEELQNLLKELVTSAAVSGHEQRLAASIADRLKQRGLTPRIDRMSNVLVTVGTGKPHRLLVANVDEPGYVVSGWTEDGYLRLQRVATTRPHPYFDQYFEGQRLWIQTATGPVSGVTAVPSIHISRTPAEARPFNLADGFVDVGARSEADVLKAGVRVLDPVTLEKTFSVLAHDRATGPFVSDRVGAAVLLSLLNTTPTSGIVGTLTVAFAAQEHFNRKGTDRISAEIEPDEVYLLEALGYEPHDNERISSLGAGIAVDTQNAPRVRRMLGRFNGMIRPANLSPQRNVPGWKPETEIIRVGIPVMFYQTPVEVIDLKDVQSTIRFLRGLIQAGQS